jgi:hypothetical protein
VTVPRTSLPESLRTGRLRWLAASLATIAAVCVALATGDAGRHAVLLEVGGCLGSFLGGTWGPPDDVSIRAGDTTDGRTQFIYRPTIANAKLRLPYCAPNRPVRLSMRSYTRVHTFVDVYVGRTRQATWSVSPMRWDRQNTNIVLPRGCITGVDLALGVRQDPLVRSSNVEHPELLVDFFEVSSPGTFPLAPAWRALVFVAPLVVFALVWAIGLGPWFGLGTSLVVDVIVALLLRSAPLALLSALPRLGAAVLAAGLLAFLMARRRWPRATVAWLAWMVATSAAVHGAWAFFPGHVPPDIHIHKARTIDLGRVPLTYQGILTYGSQFPTPSQDRGEATDALGTHMRIPYSPLPYVLYYGFYRAGLDLTWAMTVVNSVLVSLLIVGMFETAALLWNVWAGWLAAILFSIDLAAWHHVGRSHAPAVIGFVLTLGALLHLIRKAMTEDDRSTKTIAWVALAFLGYSAALPLFGLFAALWTGALFWDTRVLDERRRRRIIWALVAGAFLAIALYYGHYVPDLLRGTLATAHDVDRFPGRTFLIFHNESRQSMRLWNEGLWIPVLLGLMAALPAICTTSPRVRSLLIAWLGAWIVFMGLKELPILAKLLRWAKEDQFLSPLLCLFLAGAIGTITRSRWRWVLAGTLVLLLAWLHARDYVSQVRTLGL